MRDTLIFKIRTLEVCFGEQRIRLPPVEFFLLQLFTENEGKDLQAEYLYERIWGADMNNDYNAVRKAVSRLRQKIAGSGYTVSSVYGGSYCFERE